MCDLNNLNEGDVFYDDKLILRKKILTFNNDLEKVFTYPEYQGKKEAVNFNIMV